MTFKTEKEKENYSKRLKKKSGWAKAELLALFEMKKKFKVNIFELKGSYAGAFGIPQFLPSSYLRWARAADMVCGVACLNSECLFQGLVLFQFVLDFHDL